MGRRTSLNVALALLLAALVLFALLSPSHREAVPQATLGAAMAEPVTIRIERRGAPALEFRRTGTEWNLVEPLAAPANPQRVQELISVPGLPVLHPVSAGAADMPRFDLAPPLAALRLDDAVFAFGAEGVLDGGRYAAYRGRVSLVPDTLFLRLTQGPGFFIDPALIRAGLRPIRIALPGRVIARDGARWRLEIGTSPRDDAESLAAAWQEARAIMVRVGAGDLSGPVIAIAFDTGAVIQFEFVRMDGRPVLLRRDLGLQYHLDPELARQLLPDDTQVSGGDG